jgi:hypothetical protein
VGSGVQKEIVGEVGEERLSMDSGEYRARLKSDRIWEERSEDRI